MPAWHSRQDVFCAVCLLMQQQLLCRGQTDQTRPLACLARPSQTFKATNQGTRISRLIGKIELVMLTTVAAHSTMLLLWNFVLIWL